MVIYLKEPSSPGSPKRRESWDFPEFTCYNTARGRSPVLLFKVTFGGAKSPNWQQYLGDIRRLLQPKVNGRALMNYSGQRWKRIAWRESAAAGSQCEGLQARSPLFSITVGSFLVSRGGVSFPFVLSTVGGWSMCVFLPVLAC